MKQSIVFSEFFFIEIDDIEAYIYKMSQICNKFYCIKNTFIIRLNSNIIA